MYPFPMLFWLARIDLTTGFCWMRTDNVSAASDAFRRCRQLRTRESSSRHRNISSDIDLCINLEYQLPQEADNIAKDLDTSAYSSPSSLPQIAPFSCAFNSPFTTPLKYTHVLGVKDAEIHVLNTFDCTSVTNLRPPVEGYPRLSRLCRIIFAWIAGKRKIQARAVPSLPSWSRLYKQSCRVSDC
jgi:hypothetical protein